MKAEDLNFLQAPLSFKLMRHLLLALIIALLPLRAWVGDAMAVAMLEHPAVTAAATSEHLDCPGPATLLTTSMKTGQGMGHAAHGMDDHSAKVPQPGQDHHQHSACDVCNGPALVVGSFGAVATAQTHTLLAPLAERFASVAPQQGIKPPIS